MEKHYKEKIARLMAEIEKLENQAIPTQKMEEVTAYAYNSDVETKTAFGTKMDWVPMSKDEIRAARERKEMKLYSLRNELKLAQDELSKLEWDKPENVAKREQEAIVRDEKELRQQIEEDRQEHESEHDDLNKLVEYLELADLDDLAINLRLMRFAYKKPKSSYVTEEINLRSRENALSSKRQTTKKEYKDIKKVTIRLTKHATRTAKKYKDLYELYRKAWEIVYDIETKGISKLKGAKLKKVLNNYFTQPTGEYYFREYGNNYRLKESNNLGYECLEFTRDYNSKYNKGVRNHKI